MLSLWITFYNLLKSHLLWKNSPVKSNFENPYLQEEFFDKLSYWRILEASTINKKKGLFRLWGRQTIAADHNRQPWRSGNPYLLP